KERDQEENQGTSSHYSVFIPSPLFWDVLDIQDEMGHHEGSSQPWICLCSTHLCIIVLSLQVPGNFHVSTHSATAQPQSPDMTHLIHKLAFGEKLQVQNVQGAFNALGGADRLGSNPNKVCHTGRIMPAIWYRYDLSPITVKYTEKRQPLYRFITTICAIIGGTFTVAGIIDSCIFTASEAWKKIQIGKMS
uniref:Endoplasmic reticulum-Golgi intermediate compartment protein n=1 Tax=Salmo trutta TaxID=8032 RepID=A0A674CXJ3_SALTR